MAGANEDQDVVTVYVNDKEYLVRLDDRVQDLVSRVRDNIFGPGGALSSSFCTQIDWTTILRFVKLVSWRSPSSKWQYKNGMAAFCISPCLPSLRP
jgi:hypothetical protein